jgi:hypothetical protein
MRTRLPLATLLAGILCFAAKAARTPVPALEPVAFADTESVTNAPLRGMDGNTALFRIGISLTATPSNNLELAFGKADATGAIPFGDEEFAVGWDCGRWFVASPTNRIDGADIPDAAHRELSLEIRSVRDGRPREWRISTSGGGFVALPAEPPPWAFSRNWTHLRLTMRGVDACDPELSVRLSADGVVMFAR